MGSITTVFAMALAIWRGVLSGNLKTSFIRRKPLLVPSLVFTFTIIIAATSLPMPMSEYKGTNQLQYSDYSSSRFRVYEAGAYEADTLVRVARMIEPEDRIEVYTYFSQEDTVIGTDPEFISFQKFTITDEETSLGTIWILSPDTWAYSPDEGADLVSFIMQEWSEMGLGEIPAEPNLELNGLPAVSLLIPQSQGGAAAQEVFFIKENRLFRITMVDNLQASNAELYEDFLDSFTFID